jgi:hypothetical protein
MGLLVYESKYGVLNYDLIENNNLEYRKVQIIKLDGH